MNGVCAGQSGAELQPRKFVAGALEMKAEGNFPIAIYLSRLGGGGAANMMVKIANHFVRAGHPTTLIVNVRGGVYEERLDPAVEFVDLKASISPTAMFRLAAYLKDNAPPLLLVAMVFPNIVAVAARRLAGVPTALVISERNTTSAWLADRPAWRRWFDRALIRFAYPRADRIIAVSGGVADDLRGILGTAAPPVDVIYNPTVDSGTWEAFAAEPSHPWFSDGGPPVVVAAGRLKKQKDFPTLIEAFERLRRERPVRLIILGEGGERATLENIAATRGLADVVALPGFTDNPLCYFKRAALFVLSSRFEGFPNVLVEALASGVPVVSTDCPSGANEILEGGRYGALVPIGNASALAEAMLRALDDTPSAARTRVARACVFTVEVAAARYLDILRSCSEVEKQGQMGK